MRVRGITPRGIAGARCRGGSIGLYRRKNLTLTSGEESKGYGGGGQRKHYEGKTYYFLGAGRGEGLLTKTHTQKISNKCTVCTNTVWGKNAQRKEGGNKEHYGRGGKKSLVQKLQRNA